MLARPDASITQRAVAPSGSSNCSKSTRCASLAELDLAHARALLEVHAERSRARRQLVLEQAPVDLEVVVRRVHRRHAELDPLGDVRVAAGGGEVAQAALPQLLLLEVLASCRPPRRSSGHRWATVDSPTLNAASGAGPSRFSSTTTLVCGRVLLELDRQRQPRQPTAEDRDVVALGGRTQRDGLDHRPAALVAHRVPPTPTRWQCPSAANAIAPGPGAEWRALAALAAARTGPAQGRRRARLRGHLAQLLGDRARNYTSGKLKRKPSRERRRPESNRCKRLCRPLRSHSATSPRCLPSVSGGSAGQSRLTWIHRMLAWLGVFDVVGVVFGCRAGVGRGVGWVASFRRALATCFRVALSRRC